MNANTENNREMRWSIASSVLLIVAGILAIIAPPVSGIAVTIMVGWLLVLGGAAHLAYSWHTRQGGGLFWGMVLGIIYIVTGGYVVLHPLVGLGSLTLVLAAYLLVGAIAEFVLSFQLRPLRGSGWLLVDGIVSLILAIMIWRTWPSSALWVIGTLVGIGMLGSGFTRLAITLAARRGAPAVQGQLPTPVAGH
jgi:uncharacterized membrane protein HdeD (DUF308 family)